MIPLFTTTHLYKLATDIFLFEKGRAFRLRDKTHTLKLLMMKKLQMRFTLNAFYVKTLSRK